MLKKLFAAKNLTEGAPWKGIITFAWPMIIGNFVQQMYNAVDSIVVGQHIGDHALSAVGSVAPIMNLLLALFGGIATGAGIVISQYFGARDRKGLSLAVGNCLLLSVLASLVFTVVGPLVTRPLLAFLKTPDSFIDLCADYLNIYFLGIIGCLSYNMLAGILRGFGDSVSALLFLIVSAVLNVGLNLLFVITFDMGVLGVSLATVISQAISAVLCWIRLRNMRDICDLSFQYWKLDKQIAGRILKIGLPAGLSQAIVSSAAMMIQRLTNSLGETVITANVVVTRVDGFAMMPIFSFSQALSVFTGQNVGADRLDRVRLGIRQGMLMSVGLATVMTLLLLVAGKPVFRLFSDTDEVLNMATWMIQILAVGYICMSVTQVLNGVRRGAGDTVMPMWLTINQTVILRVAVAYGLAWLTKSEMNPNGHPLIIPVSLLISWSVGMLINLIEFRFGRWKKKMEENAAIHREKKAAA